MAENNTNNRVTRYTRAGRNGRIIQCPSCSCRVNVGHFSWVALECPGCHEMVNKYEWFVRPPLQPPRDELFICFLARLAQPEGGTHTTECRAARILTAIADLYLDYEHEKSHGRILFCHVPSAFFHMRFLSLYCAKGEWEMEEDGVLLSLSLVNKNTPRMGTADVHLFMCAPKDLTTKVQELKRTWHGAYNKVIETLSSPQLLIGSNAFS